jgi:hypothetical protein
MPEVGLQPLLDRTLDEVAEERRPKGELKTDVCGQVVVAGSIPAGFVRQGMNIKGGHCLLTTFIEATKN